MIRVIAGIILVLMISGCEAGSSEPALIPGPGYDKPWSPEQGTAEHPGWPYPQPIDWSKYEPDLKQKIDNAAKEKDCATLDKLFGEAFDYRQPNSEEILTYIDRWGSHINCPSFSSEGGVTGPGAEHEKVEHE